MDEEEQIVDRRPQPYMPSLLFNSWREPPSSAALGRVAARAAADPSDEYGFRADPEPVPGCATCADLALERRRLTRAGDLSGATDCNVLIRRHPHGAAAVPG